MARAIKLEVKLDDLRPLLRMLRADELLAESWNAALHEVGRIALSAASAGAPRGKTGELRAKLTYKVQAIPVPRYVVVKTNATHAAPTGRRRANVSGRRWRYPYAYPRRLEFDPRSRHRDWLKRAIERSWSRIGRALDIAARGIESRWARKG